MTQGRRDNEKSSAVSSRPGVWLFGCLLLQVEHARSHASDIFRECKWMSGTYIGRHMNCGSWSGSGYVESESDRRSSQHMSP